MSFTVGQLAKLTGLTVRALHHYDAIGLLVPSQRSDSGYRLYTQADIVRLYRIQALQRFGLSLTEIEIALARQGSTLPEMVSQQLAALDSQIEQATALRSQLIHLREVLARGDEPGTGEWLTVVELITQYDKYCSPEELNRLIEHNNDDAADWQALIADLRAATQSKLAPQSKQAQSLITRWGSLMLQRVGGDKNLLIKMKLAYAKDSGMQSRMEMQGGITPEMMEYLAHVAKHAHLALWSRYLSPVEIKALSLDDAWQQKLLRANGALRNEMEAGSSPNSDPTRAALKEWDSLVDMFVAGDNKLRLKVAEALQSDADLQWNWILTPDLLEFIKNAKASQSHKESQA
jgi:DNA-binding transcriptional MerR regulator